MRLYRPRDLTILMVIFNKARYLHRSLSSIFRLQIPRKRFEVLCVDDASTDNSSAIVSDFHAREDNIAMYTLPRNVGTNVARITAVRLTRSPFLTFLDPDDEFVGSGLLTALNAIILTGADIIEFGCRSVGGKFSWKKCWKSPRVERATKAQLANLFYNAKINCHLRRKVFRTTLYQAAIAAMPEAVTRKDLRRFEDKLHFAFIIDKMTGLYRFVRELGELRYLGLEDNSQSGVYQNQTKTAGNLEYVDGVIKRTFNRNPL
jgi:glycosyltransferase involved in cell wall biosynthesis